MNKDMMILKATPEHANDIAQLNDAVQKMHAKNYPNVFKYPTDASEVEGFFREQITAKGSTIFIAIDSDHAVGYVWCTVQNMRENPFKYSQDRIYIHQIYVDPEFRRRGVGLKLMQAVDGLAREEDIHNFALDSWEFNQGAHGFFERLNFLRYNVNMWRQMKRD